MRVSCQFAETERWKGCEMVEMEGREWFRFVFDENVGRGWDGWHGRWGAEGLLCLEDGSRES